MHYSVLFRICKIRKTPKNNTKEYSFVLLSTRELPLKTKRHSQTFTIESQSAALIEPPPALLGQDPQCPSKPACRRYFIVRNAPVTCSTGRNSPTRGRVTELHDKVGPVYCSDATTIPSSPPDRTYKRPKTQFYPAQLSLRRLLHRKHR